MDGGLTALGGFLYQTVVALSLKAETFQDYHDAPINNGDLETVLGFAKEGEVRYEDEDQDVSIRNLLHGEQAGYILIQIKYSRVSPPPPITKHGLEKIIERLKASEEKVRASGRRVDGYSLLTNRPLNEDAHHMAQAYRPPFYVASSLPERFWEERLRQFAQRFSCINSEIDAGIRQGIGEVLLRATNSRFYGEQVITKEMLINLFTGCDRTHEMIPEVVAQKSQQRLKALFIEPFHLDLQPLVTRQRIHDQLSKLVEQHAFVIVSGGGGNGKTAVLWQWISDAFLSELPQRRGVYYSLSPSQTVQENFLAHQFCLWAHVPHTHHWYSQEPEQILDRLEIACAASRTAALGNRPIFVLGLDAVDETFRQGDRNDLINLLQWFWEQEKHVLRQRPRATLIVTCRDAGELADHWLSITSPYGDEQAPFHEIEVSVDEFSASELVEAARLHLSPALAMRFSLLDTLTRGDFTIIYFSGHGTFTGEQSDCSAVSANKMEPSLVLQPESASLQAVDREVFEALRHPTLWHCLLKVEETTQSHVLDGETQALGDLATRFLLWFCQKVRARGKRVHKNEEMIEVLKVIARHCDPHQSPRHRKKDWVTHASETPSMNREQAEHFFEEALSAGLIAGDAKGWWRWRHPFIGEYLAATQ